MISINAIQLTQLIGQDSIQSINETDYYYEFIFENGNKVLVHKNLTGDKCAVETEGKAILVEPNELSDSESILNTINKLK